MTALHCVLLIPDYGLDVTAVTAHLTDKWMLIRARRKDIPLKDWFAEDMDGAIDVMARLRKTPPDHRAKNKIERRARLIVERRVTAAGLDHLKDPERKRLYPIVGGVRLAGRMTVDRADDIASALHIEFPWMRPATIAAWRALRASASKDGIARVGPLLIDGPPGIGKSFWTQMLARLIGTPWERIDVSGGAGQFALIGVERGWGTATEGRVIRTILDKRVADPLIYVDELDKASGGAATNGRHYSAYDSLLGLLEPGTANAWTCPFFSLQFDLSRVSWVASANGTHRIPAPLLSRMEVIQIPEMSRDDLAWVAGRETMRLGMSEAATEAVIGAVLHMDDVSKRPVDLRDVRRIVERGVALEAHPMLH